MTETHDAIVIGAGFSGLAILHHLREIGLDTVVLDAQDGVGGTWLANRYPGVRTDSEYSYYSFSFSKEVREEWTWTQRYPAGAEVLAYLNFVADRLDLRRDIRLETRVESAVYDEAANTWTVYVDGVPRWSPSTSSAGWACCRRRSTRISPVSTASRARSTTPPTGRATVSTWPASGWA